MAAHVASNIQWLTEHFESEASQVIQDTPAEESIIMVFDYEFERDMPTREIARYILDSLGLAEAFRAASEFFPPEQPLKYKPLYGAVHALMEIERAITCRSATEYSYIFSATALLSDAKEGLAFLAGKELGLMSASHATSKKASDAASKAHHNHHHLKEYVISELTATPINTKNKSHIANSLVVKTREFAKANGIPFLKEDGHEKSAYRTIYLWVLDFYKPKED